MNSAFDLLRTMTDDDLKDALARNTRKVWAYEYMRTGTSILRGVYEMDGYMHKAYALDVESYNRLLAGLYVSCDLYRTECERRGLLPKERKYHEEEMQATRPQVQDQEGEIPEAGTWIVKGVQSYPHVKTYPIKKGAKK